MPATSRPKPLYQRGEFKLYPRTGRALEIVWYDERGKRERCRSAGTTDERQGRIALDNIYVEKHGGVPVCPTCGRPRDQRGEKIAVLVANYLETKEAKDAVFPRINHLLDFMGATGRIENTADQADDAWAKAFRKWSSGVPIVSPTGKTRKRAPGTTENSLIALAAAMRLGGVEPSFEGIPTKQLSRTPSHRSAAEEMSRMFRYAMEPKKKRDNLLRFLRASVATWGRPDAVHEIDTTREKGQWYPAARVLKLNPMGRKQTKKRRAEVPVARQFAPHLDAVGGPYIPVNSVKSAWEAMAGELKLPAQGESGMKLIRRSVMTLARTMLGEEHWIQGRMMAGHVPATVSDIYAVTDPANLGRVLAVTEAIIDAIEAAAPGAFTADLPQDGAKVVSILRGKVL